MPVLNWVTQQIKPATNAALILMYHRIINIEFDPWDIAVSPEHFEQQLKVLKENYNVISLTELAAAIRQKNIAKNSICITFDDAYADNYLFAKPLLEKYNLPATFFVASAYIDKNLMFWWDELQEIFLPDTYLPENLELEINHTKYSFKIDNKNHNLKNRQNWRWMQPPPDSRCKVYLDIWTKLKPLPQPQITRIITYLKDWAKIPQVSQSQHFAVSLSQLSSIIANPLFNVGAHTATHPALSNHPAEVQTEEILLSIQYLSALTAKTIDAIAFPYGDYNQTSIDVVKKLLLKSAFTTKAKLVYNDSDTLQLGRFQIANMDAKHFRKNLKTWLKAK